MLDMAKTGCKSVEAKDLSWLILSQTETRLVQRYRQISEQERRQVQRLIELLADNPQDLEI